MSDMDVFAAMGIAGFGKKTKQRQLDPKRFEKNKREEVRPPTSVVLLKSFSELSLGTYDPARACLCYSWRACYSRPQ